MNKNEKDYILEFRKKNYTQTNIDLKKDVRKKLDEIVKIKKISISSWITEKIEEEYKNLKQ